MYSRNKCCYSLTNWSAVHQPAEMTAFQQNTINNITFSIIHCTLIIPNNSVRLELTTIILLTQTIYRNNK